MKRCREDNQEGEDTPSVDSLEADILAYLRRKEVPIAQTFAQIQQVVTLKMRSVLVDWMVEVFLEYHMTEETLFLSISLLDRMFACHALEAKSSIQLLGIACMWIAGKFQEIFPPSIDDFIYISDNAYTRDELIAMEKTVLQTLDYQLCYPTAYTFLCHFSLGVGGLPSGVQFCVASYMLELALLELEFSTNCLPSLLAAAAIGVAFTQVNDGGWTDLCRVSQYSQSDIEPVMQKLIKLHQAEKCHPRATFQKYSRNKYHRVVTQL